MGLIRLHQGEFAKADLHFKKAIGFNGYEDKLGSQFYKCANIINPSWIALASLTRLQKGDVEEAKELMEMAFTTLENFEFTLDRQSWAHIIPVYWTDLRKRGITTDKWQEAQCINLFNTQSIIAHVQCHWEEAIDLVSHAIFLKDLAIKRQIFHGESEESGVLHHNRGVLYSQKGLYQEALLDLTKAITLKPRNAETYFHRGNVFLFLGECSNALDDFDQAVILDPNNLEYYRQRALAHMIQGSIDKAKPM